MLNFLLQRNNTCKLKRTGSNCLTDVKSNGWKKVRFTLSTFLLGAIGSTLTSGLYSTCEGSMPSTKDSKEVKQQQTTLSPETLLHITEQLGLSSNLEQNENGKYDIYKKVTVSQINRLNLTADEFELLDFKHLYLSPITLLNIVYQLGLSSDLQQNEQGRYVIDEIVTVSQINRLNLTADELKQLDFKHVELTKEDIEQGHITIDAGGHCNVPHYVTHIAEEAFSSNKNLTNIKFPKTLKHIDRYALRNCENLKTVIFNGIPISINFYAFLGCKNLEHIYVVIDEKITKTYNIMGSFSIALSEDPKVEYLNENQIHLVTQEEADIASYASQLKTISNEKKEINEQIILNYGKKQTKELKQEFLNDGKKQIKKLEQHFNAVKTEMMAWIKNISNCTNNNYDDSIFTNQILTLIQEHNDDVTFTKLMLTLIQNKIEEKINADKYYEGSEVRRTLLEQNIETIKQCINNRSARIGESLSKITQFIH